MVLGSRKCLRNRYLVCKNVAETNTFQGFVDKKVYKINHYLLSFKVCEWHTGQTVDEFRYRWNSYKDNNRRCLRGDEHKKQAWSFAHFRSLDHHSFLEDTEITF